jgi:hypothetical protein
VASFVDADVDNGAPTAVSPFAFLTLPTMTTPIAAKIPQRRSRQLWSMSLDNEPL